MITLEELSALRNAYRSAEARYNALCQMHEAHLATSQAVTAARNTYENLKATYDLSDWEYHQQNAKPAGGRQRA